MKSYGSQPGQERTPGLQEKTDFVSALFERIMWYAMTLREGDPVYEFEVYVVGGSKATEKGIASLRELLDKELHLRYSLRVIDVLVRPELAEEVRILATPTVIKVLPSPERRAIADLGDKETLLIRLGLE